MKIELMKNSATKMAFLSAIGDDFSKLTEITNQFDLKNRDSFEVVFIVNGVELDFQKVITALVDCYNEQVALTARELIQFRLDCISDRFDDMIVNMKQEFKQTERDIDDMFRIVSLGKD